MANHLDLEEQEQLDQLKHFWNNWGTIISFVLVVVFGSVAAWNGYQFWQNREALHAASLLNAIENAAQASDKNRLEQAFIDIRNKYAATTQAGQAGFIAAKFEIERGNLDAGQAALDWVAAHSSDDAYKTLAKLRLANLLIEKKSYDSALQHLTGKFDMEFDAIVADRKGDIFSLQNKKQEAILEYARAYKNMNDRFEYRRLIEVKLNALGVRSKNLVNLMAAGAIK